MPKFTIRAAEARLSELVARAAAGEEIVIVRRKKPVARLVPFTPVTPAKPRRKFGSMKGKIELTDAFFEPLPEEELRAWGQV